MKNKLQEFEIALALLEEGHDANNITQELAGDQELLEMLEVVKLTHLLPRQKPSPARQLLMLNQVKSRLLDDEAKPVRSFPWLGLPGFFKKNPAKAMPPVTRPGANPGLRKLGEVVMAFTLVLVVILGLLATTRDLPQDGNKPPATPVRSGPATVPVFTSLPAYSADALTAIPVTATATESATIVASPTATLVSLSPVSTATAQAASTTAIQPTSKVKPAQSQAPRRPVVTAPATPTRLAPTPTVAVTTQAPTATSTPVPATTQLPPVPSPTPKPAATATAQPTPRPEPSPTPNEKEEGDPHNQGGGD